MVEADLSPIEDNSKISIEQTKFMDIEHELADEFIKEDDLVFTSIHAKTMVPVKQTSVSPMLKKKSDLSKND